MSVNLEKVLRKIQNEKTNKLKPDNIRYGVNALGVQGTLRPVQIDGGDIGMQMYLQDTTPEAQDGIWVNTDKEINDIYLETEAHTTNYSFIYSNDTTDDGDASNIIKGRTVPADFLGSTYAQLGNIVHIFGFYSSTASQNVSPKINQHYMYNFDTDTWTKLSDTPTPMGYCACEWVNDDTIYIIGSAHADYYKYVYKYTISTDTYERLNDIPDNITNSYFTLSNIQYYGLGSCYDGENKIYLLSGNYICSFDVTTGSWLYLTQMNWQDCGVKNMIYYSGSLIVGTYFYSTNKMRKYNILTNSWSDFGTSNRWSLGSGYWVWGKNVGGILYVVDAPTSVGVNSSYGVYYTSLSSPTTIYGALPLNTSAFSSMMFKGSYPICYFTNENYDILLGFAGTSGSSSMIAAVLNDKHYEFDNDTIILYTDSGNGGRYTTELYKNERVINGGKIKQQFTDVNIYDKSQEKIIKNLTTYYGNGTSWVKIK